MNRCYKSSDWSFLDCLGIDIALSVSKMILMCFLTNIYINIGWKEPSHTHTHRVCVCVCTGVNVSPHFGLTLRNKAVIWWLEQHKNNYGWTVTPSIEPISLQEIFRRDLHQRDPIPTKFEEDMYSTWWILNIRCQWYNLHYVY